MKNSNALNFLHLYEDIKGRGNYLIRDKVKVIGYWVAGIISTKYCRVRHLL
jgi:hypothetical protein